MRKKLTLPDISFDDLRAFPESSRQEIGYQLDGIQQELNPCDWKPFSAVGPSMWEIRTRDADGIYCIMCITKFEEAVYVLHCFQKKTQTASQSDVDSAKRRYKEPVRGWENEN